MQKVACLPCGFSDKLLKVRHLHLCNPPQMEKGGTVVKFYQEVLKFLLDYISKHFGSLFNRFVFVFQDIECIT
jgi:hypothetical protein